LYSARQPAIPRKKEKPEKEVGVSSSSSHGVCFSPNQSLKEGIVFFFSVIIVIVIGFLDYHYYYFFV
jgi:hypothetical protein